MWERWAERVGAERSTFFAALGATIERRRHHREVFSLFGSTFEQARRPGDHERYELYPDAVRCLQRLRSAGLVVGVVGNQPAETEAWLRAQLGEEVLGASSASWGVEKPSPAFFRRVLELAGAPAGQVVYVGDRVDNDIVPAAELGLRTVFVRRGPWGLIHGDWPEAARADARVADLDEAAAAILRLAR